ncbi:MAG: hypothetical protein K0V04_05670 [Deltaproteobacteria bacterium]|nr:hypothetical protein [Deltaproteobacteria bacterium]
MIIALLVLAMAPAPVFVEPVAIPADRDTRSLHDQLMMRLLEEGYPLAPSADHATRTLRVQPTEDGIRVEARGQDVQAFSVTTGPVLPLEVVHRAMEALDEVTPRASLLDEQPSPRIAVHVEQTPEGLSPETVRRLLVERLLARRGTVVPLDAAPDSVLCADGEGDALSLSRGDDVGDCGHMPQLIAVVDDDPDPQVLSNSIDQLLSDSRSSERSTVGTITPARSTPTAGLVTDREPSTRTDGTAIRIEARTGLYGRLSAADAAVGTTLRVGREPGPGGLFDIMLLPSSAPNIAVFETSISAGFGWMWTLSDTVALYLRGLGGVQVHRFRQRGGQTGHRADWTLEAPLGTSLRLARGLRLDLSVRGGLARRPREHRVADEIVWARSQWRVGGSVGLSYGWRPR